jgi:hypothetical protein
VIEKHSKDILEILQKLNLKILSYNVKMANIIFYFLNNLRLRAQLTQVGDVVALDPGVRNFQSYYSPNGTCGVINPSDKLDKKFTKLANLVELGNRVPKKAIKKMRKKVFDAQLIYIGKAQDFLLKNYKVILIPEFNVKQMINKEDRKISKETVKAYGKFIAFYV